MKLISRNLVFENHKKIAKLIRSFQKDFFDEDYDNSDDEMFDIRLRSVDDGTTEGVVLKPKIGSWLFVADIGNNKHDHIALIYEAVEEVTLTIDSLKIVVNTEGFKITNGAESLKTVFNDILDKMKTLKILTTTGIATVSPVEVPLIEILKNRLNTILK